MNTDFLADSLATTPLELGRHVERASKFCKHNVQFVFFVSKKHPGAMSLLNLLVKIPKTVKICAPFLRESPQNFGISESS